MRKHDLSTCAYYIELLWMRIMRTRIIVAGRTPPSILPRLCGATLLACRKKNGGLRPIAVGGLLCRLISKCLSRRASLAPRRYTNFIVRNHYILAPGRETVRETSKSCVSRSNRESWEACRTRVVSTSASGGRGVILSASVP